MNEFFKEFLFLVALATGIGFFIIGFKPVFKVFSTWLPVSGLREAAAA